jgi:23S rRNA-/tRNA-specific pseudouridylate synthase
MNTLGCEYVGSITSQHLEDMSVSKKYEILVPVNMKEKKESISKNLAPNNETELLC